MIKRAQQRDSSVGTALLQTFGSHNIRSICLDVSVVKSVSSSWSIPYMNWRENEDLEHGVMMTSHKDGISQDDPDLLGG